MERDAINGATFSQSIITGWRHDSFSLLGVTTGLQFSAYNAKKTAQLNRNKKKQQQLQQQQQQETQQQQISKKLVMEITDIFR